MNKQKFKKGDKLVMVRDGQHWAAFRKGDKVVFVEYDKFTESKIVVKGSWEGNHNIIQIISIDDVALITKTKTPCEALAALNGIGVEVAEYQCRARSFDVPNAHAWNRISKQAYERKDKRLEYRALYTTPQHSTKESE